VTRLPAVRSSRRLRALLLAALGLLALTGLSACGDKPAQRTIADTEGPYIDLGELKYQVQISRQLNPRDVEDRAYFIGLPPEEAKLAEDETWYAVFMRVENDTDEPHPTALSFEIEDTTGKRFEPLELSDDNVFAYRNDGALKPKELIPTENSAAADGPIGGSLLLFKLTYSALANRPLEMIIKSVQVPQTEAKIDLDV